MITDSPNPQSNIELLVTLANAMDGLPMKGYAIPCMNTNPMYKTEMSWPHYEERNRLYNSNKYLHSKSP